MTTSRIGQSLELANVTHRYGAATAVDDVSLKIAGGELVALLGPSGCGKTTLLRAIGGFISQTGGEIRIGGDAVDHRPPNKRSVGIVFQNYALFPHMTAAQNVAYGLEARGTPRAAARQRVDDMLAMVKLQHLSERYPKEMSGGQQQRIALARALAISPSVLLLDEPFAALDKNLRLDMQIEIKRIQRLSGTTTLIVTHDQEEALSMADRVAVFNQGRLEQFGTPSEIYDAPRSLFVNAFVGTANLLAGCVTNVGPASVHVRLDLGSTIEARSLHEPLSLGDKVTACIRAEQLRASDDPSGVAGVVEVGLPLGATVVHEVRTADGKSLKISEPRGPGTRILAGGTAVYVHPVNAHAANAFRTNTT